MLININYDLINSKIKNERPLFFDSQLFEAKDENTFFSRLSTLCLLYGLTLDEVIIIESFENTEIEGDIYKNILNYLNKKANRSFKSVKSNNKLINSRLSEGYKEEDFYKVIDLKCKQWLGTEFEKYLRPLTLFGDNFDRYLNEAIYNKGVEDNGK